MIFITGRPVFHNLLFLFSYPLHQESFKPFFPPKSSPYEILIPHISDTLRIYVLNPENWMFEEKIQGEPLVLH